MLELQHGQNVVVRVHGDLQQAGELLGHGAAGGDAAAGQERTGEESQQRDDS